MYDELGAGILGSGSLAEGLGEEPFESPPLDEVRVHVAVKTILDFLHNYGKLD